MIRTTLNPTHIAHTARCVLVAATLTATTALIGGGLQSPVAAHAASIRPATTSAASYIGRVRPLNKWVAYAPSPLNDQRATFIKKPFHLFRNANSTTFAVPYDGRIRPLNHWSAYTLSPLNRNPAPFSTKPFHLFRNTSSTTSVASYFGRWG
jgi:hypothetical protein